MVGRAGNEMVGRAGAGTVTARIAGTATRQQGLVTRRQLHEHGLDDSAIKRRVANGTLYRVFHGVYLVGHQARAPIARETAALLACGNAAVISHRSAAALWSMVPRDGGEVHVTVLRRKVRSRPGLRVHQTAHLTSVDIRPKDGIALTSPVRTLLDLAADGDARLEDAFTEAHGLRLLRSGELEAAIGRASGRPGVIALRALIASHASGYTRSKGELEMRRLVRAAHLPPPLVNAHLHGYMVDFLWSDRRLVVEFDGYAAHGHRVAFERDRRRDAVLVAAGYRVIRVTWRQLLDEPLTVVARLATSLAVGDRADARPRG